MPSPKTEIHMSDAVSALLLGHHQQCPTSSDLSFSHEPCNEARGKESVLAEKGMMIPKHGFVIESSPIHTESFSSHFTSIFDSSALTPSIHPNTETPANMEIEAQAPTVQPVPIPPRRPRSGSEGLDYLAFLAEQERQSLDLPTVAVHPIPIGNSRNDAICVYDPMMQQQQQQQQTYSSEHSQLIACSVVSPPTTIVNNPQTSSSSSSSSSSDTDDSEAMPPPQPRRPRSISNPDYMMSNVLYAQGTDHSEDVGTPAVKSQQHFVLPPQLLREELAKARNAVVRKAAAEITMETYSYKRYNTSISGGFNFRSSSTIPEHAVYLQSSNDQYDYGKHTSTGVEEEEDYDDEEVRPESGDEYDDDDEEEADSTDAQEDQDLIDNINLDTPMDASISSIELLRRARSRLLEDLLSETSALTGMNDKSITILPHTLSKYKMVYNQNGRIGIYTPQERAAIIARYHAKRAHRNWNKKIRYNCRKNLADRRLRVKGRFVKRSMEEDSQGLSNDAMLSPSMNDHMPDVNDPDAGFCPTIEQPYRRLRRHTVT